MEHTKLAGDTLAKFLSAEGLSQRTFAEAINSKQSIVSRLAAGKIKPGIDLAATIEVATGGEVPAVMWAAPPQLNAKVTGGDPDG